jgi:hypothetical protein
MVDVPSFVLNPFFERASVSVKKPISLIVLDQVECVKVSLAMRAGLGLKSPAFYFVSAFGVGKQTDISDDLTDLCKLDGSRDLQL